MNKQKRNSQIIRGSMAAFFLLLAAVFAVLAFSKASNPDAEPVLRPGGETTASTTEEATTGEPPAPLNPELGRAPAEGEKVIYLTFDDGPTKNTVNIMDTLERYDVKGTFFVVHSYDGCEAQIKEIYDRGHQVALHSYSHDYSIYRSTDTYFADLQKISDLVYNATGYRCKLVRFPGGSSNTISRNYSRGIMSELTKALTERGYAYFDWNADSHDASGRVVDADTIVSKSTEAIGTRDPVVLLMHDAALKTTTVDALPRVIEAYRDAGYRFDVLSEQSFTVHHSVGN